MGRFVIATNPNIEDALEREITSCIESARVHFPGIEGFVFVDVEDSCENCEALKLLRCAHFVGRLIGVEELPTCSSENTIDVIAKLAARNIPQLNDVASFRVRTQRFGSHSFRSVDVERAVGEVIHESTGVPARMKGAACIVRADVIGKKLIFSVQIHSEELSKRLHPEFIRDAAIKPNVAAAMLQFSEFGPRDVLLDPFVGSGTIAIEAAIKCPSASVIGLDKSERVLLGAKANAEKLNVQVDLRVANARNLCKIVEKGSVDRIVTNPPWGVRIGKSDDIDDLYRGFLASAVDALRVGGCLTVLLVRWESFLHHCRASGRWKVVMARPVRTGDMLPVLFVVKKVEDEMWSSIKRNIMELTELAKVGDLNESKEDETGGDATVDAPRKRRFSQ